MDHPAFIRPRFATPMNAGDADFQSGIASTLCQVRGMSPATISPLSPLWPPSAHSAFICPQTSEEASEIKKWLYGLRDGQAFACRGRDYKLNSMLDALHATDRDANDALETCAPPHVTDWEYGVGIKMNRAVFLLWETKVEKHDIGTVDLITLLHVCGRTVSDPPIHISPSVAPAVCSANPVVIILCHGFSPDHGPSYPLLILLKDVLTARGHHVILPDFTVTYAYGSARGRSERVCIVLESVLRSRSQFPNSCVVLIGHSQGGAAAAQACRRSVVCDGCIRGLVMLGSESARERISPPEWIPNDDADHTGPARAPMVDIYQQLPSGLSPPQILMLHSTRDAVISRLAIQQLVGTMLRNKVAVLARNGHAGVRVGLRRQRGVVG